MDERRTFGSRGSARQALLGWAGQLGDIFVPSSQIPQWGGLADGAKYTSPDTLRAPVALDWSLGRLIANRGNAGAAELMQAAEDYGNITPIFAGGKIDGSGRKRDSFLFHFEEANGLPMRTIDPLASRDYEAVPITLEGGNRMWRLPEAGVVLNTVQHRCPRGDCGPATVWGAVHNGRKPLDQVITDMEMMGEVANLTSEGRIFRPRDSSGTPHSFAHGTPTSLLNMYFLSHGFRELDHEINGMWRWRELMDTIGGEGIIRADGHVYEVRDGSSVDRNRFVPSHGWNQVWVRD